MPEINKACLDLYNFFSTGEDIYYPGAAAAKIDRHYYAVKVDLYFSDDCMPQECKMIEKGLEDFNRIIQGAFTSYAEHVIGKVANAYELVAPPNYNEESEYYQEQYKKGYGGIYTQGHGMRAMIYIRDHEAYNFRYVCLRTIAHKMVKLRADMPVHFPPTCIGEQLGLTKKNIDAARDVFFVQNVLARFVVIKTSVCPKL
eukprot:6212360-Pleurochrysis_carterae.AAC.1